MPLPSFADHTITVVDPGTKLVHNSPSDDWTKATTRVIRGCLVEPATTEESPRDADTIRASWRVKLPAEATPPKASSKIRHPLAAGDYQVQGEVMAVPGVSQPIDHRTMLVERWRTGG